MDLSYILADKDFGLQMRFQKREVAEFFGPTIENDVLLAERRRWIAEDPEKTIAMTPEGIAPLDETIEMARSLETLPATVASDDCFSKVKPIIRCRALGECWEPDFLLMTPDKNGVFRLTGGSLCFPSHWDLRDKLSRSIDEIHEPVPSLNTTLGRQINGFLCKIKPEISWERENWGLSRTSERNLHPSRNLPRLDERVKMHEVWFRLEQQSLVALPKTGGILFGIRVVVIPMREIYANSEWRIGMIRALDSMPEDMANYKGISSARGSLLKLLNDE